MWLDPPGGGCNIPTYLTTMLLLAVLALTNGESISLKKKKYHLTSDDREFDIVGWENGSRSRDATMSRFVEVVALLLKIRSKAYATALYLDHLIYASNAYKAPWGQQLTQLLIFRIALFKKNLPRQCCNCLEINPNWSWNSRLVSRKIRPRFNINRIKTAPLADRYWENHHSRVFSFSLWLEKRNFVPLGSNIGQMGNLEAGRMRSLRFESVSSWKVHTRGVGSR